jgi:aryl-phospho-beta-D-glucosidase BglC (GH1 family)
LQDIQDLQALGANLLNASYPGILNEDSPYAVNEMNRQYLDNLISWAEQTGVYVVIHMRTGPGRNESAITTPTGDINNDV